MKMFRPVIALVAVLALSACSVEKLEEVKALNDSSAVGNAFTQQLTAGYQDFVNSELKTYKDHADALHFSRKGLAAARGDMVMPEPVSDWNVMPGHAEELIVARSRLVNTYALGAREMQPALAATAQVKYDCWIEEQEENFQPNQISGCKSDFMNALAQLEAAMPAAPAPAPEPEPMMVDNSGDLMVDPNAPMAVKNAKYIVFFDFDESGLNTGANSILDAAAEEIRKRNLSGVDIVGHTDTSGSRDYNEKLSMRRAAAVRQGLIQRGINPSVINTNHRGESELMVDTTDDVREPANRRAEITFR